MTVFKIGDFRPYVVKADKIHVGGEVEIDIFEGDEIEFDGTTLRYDGSDYHCPQLKGAINRGWLSPEGA